MSKATNTHTTSRRRLLAAVPVLVLPGAALAASAAPNADAELIALCADFNLLEQRIDALFDSSVSTLSFEAADATAGVIEVDQHRLLDRICMTVPATDAGCLAVVRSLALLSPDYADALSSQPTMDERLASVLLRGMIGRADA